MPDHRSWLTGVCVQCGYNVVVTQPTEDCADYWWYCSNKLCRNHNPGLQTGDMEKPDWVEMEEKKNA